jgi:hypothetical protein
MAKKVKKPKRGKKNTLLNNVNNVNVQINNNRTVKRGYRRRGQVQQPKQYQQPQQYPVYIPVGNNSSDIHHLYAKTDRLSGLVSALSDTIEKNKQRNEEGDTTNDNNNSTIEPVMFTPVARKSGISEALSSTSRQRERAASDSDIQAIPLRFNPEITENVYNTLIEDIKDLREKLGKNPRYTPNAVDPNDVNEKYRIAHNHRAYLRREVKLREVKLRKGQ